MTHRAQSNKHVHTHRINSVTTAQSNNLDESWAVLTHSSIGGETSDSSLSPVIIQHSSDSLLDITSLRQKFKESRVVKATVPLHLSNLKPEQILEINFLAGAIVSKNPNIATDKLVADLAMIYSKEENDIENELAKKYFGQQELKKDEFVPLDKGQNEEEDPVAAKAKTVKIEEIVTLAATKINLPTEKIEGFVEKLQEMEINYEYDLYNLTDAKLRAYGISDRMILQIKKIIEELNVVRKIMNGGVSKQNEKAAAAPQLLREKSNIPEKPAKGVKLDPVHDYGDDSLDEDTWDCHGMGR